MKRGVISQSILDGLNVEQARDQNRHNLEELGGLEALAELLGVNINSGWTDEQVLHQREIFGDNKFPESKADPFYVLLFEALTDATLLILIAAASVSLAIGIITEPGHGWIEGTAIFIAVFLVSFISAGNDYTKQLQFLALEKSSANDERCSVLRGNTVRRINPVDIVVGDILTLQVDD
jgi:Ca2+-transporting ATPase